MTTQEQPDKSELIRYLLEKEGRVMVCLDATRKGVAVPRRFALDRGLRLVFNSRMPQPIHIGEDSIESELRFGGAPHYCILPFAAVWGVFNPDTGHGGFWLGDMPPEILEEFDTYGMEAQIPSGLRLQDAPSRKEAEQPPVVPKSGKPQLHVVARGEGQENLTDPGKPPPPRKPHLRLVK